MKTATHLLADGQGTETERPDDLTRVMRTLWDKKSDTYDNSSDHYPTSPLMRAAWSAALRRVLPPPPARLLDVGAGTGFLSLLLAGQGYQVTALDVSEQMLARLEAKAAAGGLAVRTVLGNAAEPPLEDFDAVVERHLVWTLPDPLGAATAWRAAAPRGRLALFAVEAGRANGLLKAGRARARALVRSARGECPHDGARYGPELVARLPLGHGARPEDLVELVAAAGWGPGRVERLVDVDWAARRAASTVVDRLLRPPPWFAVAAGS